MAVCSTEGIKAVFSNFQIKASQIPYNPETQKFTMGSYLSQ